MRSEMAYAAVVSLKETIQRLQNSSPHIISPQIIGSAYDQVLSFQGLLKRLDNNNNNRSARVNALDEQIKETVCGFEHVLESCVSNQSLSLSVDVQKVNVAVDSFIQSAMKLEDDYAIERLTKEEEEEEDDDDSDALPIADYNGGKMVGVDDLFGRVRHYLLRGGGGNTRIANLIGMAGIGKTTLARRIYEDQSVEEYYDFCVWVTVGPKYHWEKILHSIVAEVVPEIDEVLLEQGDGERVATLEKMMVQCLEDKRLLIVFDDVWGKKFSNKLQRFLPTNYCESAVVVTCRSKTAAYIKSFWKFHHYMELLNAEESWDLLRHKVFGEEELCSAPLEKAGRKIAEKCQGLPLTIIVVADILSKAEKTVEYWEAVAEKENSVFKDAYDQMSKVLLPSYRYLPQHLKACFLYMGVFPQNYEIRCTKLVMMWTAEGFLELSPSKTVEDVAMECLDELDDESLIVARRSRGNNEIKTCSLYSVVWHMCNREARKIRFSHIMSTLVDGSAQAVKSQRRLCVHNNILFAIKDVHNAMASNSDARSLLCTGPHHQYPVPICFGLRFLKILDALTDRLYEFPVEVLTLVRLRYLALTCNDNIPASISKLRNLQCLIVNRHLSIKSSGNPSYLPDEIWGMKELKHVHIMGNDLPDPRGCAFLPNLLTLLNVGTDSCTKSVFQGIPNLKKLGIHIELPVSGGRPLSCFDHISHLHKLESLKCVVVNPIIIQPESVSSPPHLSISSPCLKKLTLSGLGYPWDCISEIESLPMLEVLKLQNYAFRGPQWETRGGGFPRLKVLLIEDSDLVRWTAGHWGFPKIAYITLKHCYKLEEMPREVGDLITTIEVVECSPLAERGARLIQRDQLYKENGVVDVYVRSSRMG